MNPPDDIIAAIVTPIGEGGISVIRICGAGSIELSEKRFRGKAPLSAALTHTAHFGHFIDLNGGLLDEVIAIVFRAPHSYTTEDTVEINCHGGLYISRKILETLLSAGARSAGPGEFTKRAFLNGRIDLSQAEAVADLIHSRSEASHKIAIDQLQGRLSRDIVSIRNKILDVLGLLELDLDFIEEGVIGYSATQILDEVTKIIEVLSTIIDSYQCGKICKEGVRVAIVGKPNVGKSSIFNYLLNSNRTIVTEIPGTTRDFIEESITLDGIIFTLIDTAGIRSTTDLIESEGIERTHSKIADSDIILLVIDSHRGITDEDTVIIKNLQKIPSILTKLILVANKADITSGSLILENKYFDIKSNGIIISAKTGNGIQGLKNTLVAFAAKSTFLVSDNCVVITNERHLDLLKKAKACLSLSLKDLLDRKSNEFIIESMKATAVTLSELIGKITADDVLNSVFSRFCIGK